MEDFATCSWNAMMEMSTTPFYVFIHQVGEMSVLPLLVCPFLQSSVLLSIYYVFSLGQGIFFRQLWKYFPLVFECQEIHFCLWSLDDHSKT